MTAHQTFVRAATLVAAAIAIAAVPAAGAAAQEGSPGFDIKENESRVKADGPGFRVTVTKHQVRTEIDEETFGIPSAGHPVVVEETDLGAVGPLRPFVCENGTYTLQSGIFRTTERTSSLEPRPAPYTAAFNSRFPIFTFVGVLEGTVTNEEGETLRVVLSDLAHEVLTPESFSSTNPIHGFFVDENGEVRDRISLIGRVNIDRTTGEAVYEIEDRGTCRQHANLGPGGEQAVVTGPFFVLPFNAPLTVPEE